MRPGPDGRKRSSLRPFLIIDSFSLNLAIVDKRMGQQPAHLRELPRQNSCL